jgi:steroid 5-alpha reductase family enzyme
VTYLLAAATALAAAALTMAVAALVARAQGRVAVVDVAWRLGFVLVATTTALVGQVADEGDPGRRWLLVGMVAVWGLLLSWHIHDKSVGDEDPRYVTLMGGTLAEVGMARAVRKVFGIQGAAIWLVSLPVVVAMVDGVAWWPVVWVGAALWALGVVFESVGDRQLAAYTRTPKAERPAVMDQGLWRYTRHPNYFGDACIWWGLWLVGGLASGWLPALATALAPIAMTYFLVFATGARLLEREMMQRPGYPEYAARTSMFVPLPRRTK